MIRQFVLPFPGAPSWTTFGTFTRAWRSGSATLLRRVVNRPRWLVWAYLLAAAGAEVLTARFGSIPGLAIQVTLLVCLAYRAAKEPAGPARNLILAVALVPLSRVLLLGATLAPLVEAERELAVIALLAGAVVVTARQVGLPVSTFGWGSATLDPATTFLRDPRFQLLLGVGGVGLGLIESTIYRPPTIPALGVGAFLVEALVLVALTGFVGEAIFRGVILNTTSDSLGCWGFLYTALLFAVVRAGHRPVADLLFAVLVGLLLASVARSTQTILGIALAEGVASVTVFLILPALQATESGLIHALGLLTLWLAAGVGGTALAAVAWFGAIQPIIRARTLQGIRERASREDLSRIHRDLVRRGRALKPTSVPAEDWRLSEDGVISGPSEWSRSLRSAVVQASRHSQATRSSINAVVRTTAQPIQSLLQSLQETFAGIPDPRSPRGRRQPLPLVLALATYAMLYGAESVYSVARWLRGHQPELAARPEVDHPKAPAPTTLNRIFTRIDVVAFECALRVWARTNLPGGEEALIVDEKSLRGIHGTPLPGVRLADGFQPPARLEAGDPERPAHSPMA
ncbi:MAG TPA: transposase family protein [Chloroflexota bacterium]|nr:transposase family protein [Chloroflexota bacterium]